MRGVCVCMFLLFESVYGIIVCVFDVVCIYVRYMCVHISRCMYVCVVHAYARCSFLYIIVVNVYAVYCCTYICMVYVYAYFALYVFMFGIYVCVFLGA